MTGPTHGSAHPANHPTHGSARPVSAPLRVANCSGFYGDRLSAMREQLTGGEVDVITGDWLAELTMMILFKDTLKDPSAGYAKTFLTQVADCWELARERGVRIVSNAGGLNPKGLAEKLRGLGAAVAYVDGDNLAPRAAELGFAGAVTANAYLGAFGIARALAEGAQIVVTGRVTDASLVVGPAIWHHGWGAGDLDALAGAVVAGHVIECGTQATGGNFSGFLSLPRDARPLGFPIAEVAADGSAVITKHPGTGGVVTVDTVTSQLLYEIQTTRYLNPDVTVRLDTVALTQQAEDRVLISGTKGEAPPPTLKVGVTVLGGYRNVAEVVLVGLDIEQKAAWLRAQLEAALADRGPARIVWDLVRTDRTDAATEETASARLRISVFDEDQDRVGKAFTAPLVELALASFPGFTLTAPPGRPSAYGVFRSHHIPCDEVRHTVHHHDGREEVVA